MNPEELHTFLTSCSYTDFVGTVNQTNVPPGAYTTVNQWVRNGSVDSSSFVYEIACTTGFSLREVSRLTGCEGEGVDLSEASVATANRTVDGSELAARLNYYAGDGIAHTPARTPTHIIVGAALGFFPQPRKVVERCVELFGKTGYLLAAPFYTVSDIPSDLIKEAKSVLDITPTTAREKEILADYRGLQVLFENRMRIQMETQDELAHYCESTARRAMSQLDQSSDKVYQLIYDRLFQIKDLCNRLRPHQGYSILVLRYLESEYPNRYVELF